MGAAESTAKTAESTAKIRKSFTKINDTLWVLYSPHVGEVTMDIVFFHGLQLGDSKDAFWKTWIVRGSDVAKDGVSEEIWPRKWLSKMSGFSQARMLSVSYNSCIRKVDGQLRMYSLAENLVEDVILGKAQIGQNRPVILVGHSWGGLVIKRMVIRAINRRSILQESTLPSKDVDIGKITNFLKNIRGVYYYATPHNGSRLADLGRKLLPGASPILKLLGTLNEDTAIINSEFEQQRKIPAAAVAEGLDTRYGWPVFGFKARVVEPASARYGINQHYTDITANHFDVCKAEDSDSAVIIKLTDFIFNNVSWNDSVSEFSDLPTPPSGLPGSSQAGTSNESPQDDLDKRLENLRKVNFHPRPVK